jgi:hypothetical protein
MFDFAIIAEREIIVKKTGKEEIQYVELFDCLPEPNAVEIEEILKSADPVKAYINLLFKDAEGKDCEVPVYAEDDIWEEREPVGTKIINTQKEYAEEVEKKVEEYLEEGWDVRLVY